MIVTAQDAHDFCIVAATTIPILVLARFIVERSPFEDAALAIEQRTNEMKAETERLEGEVLRLEGMARRKPGRAILRLLRLELIMQRPNKASRRERQAEAKALEDRIKTLRRKMIEVKEESHETVRGVERTTNMIVKLSAVFTAFALSLGLVGEFVSLLGILGVVDGRVATGCGLAGLFWHGSGTGTLSLPSGRGHDLIQS